MKIDSAHIYLRDIRLFARHGVMPQERETGGEFIVNISMRYDISKAMADDDLSGTVNYADVYHIVEREMQEPSKLLEHVAGRIAGAIFEAFPLIEEMDIDIRKENPPMGAHCKGAGVALHLLNDLTPTR